MGRKKKEKKNENENFEEKDEFDFRLHPDTKKGVWGIIFFGAAIILFLAGLGKAGPFGDFIHRLLEKFFGWGYYLWPLIFFVLAAVFLASERKKIYLISFLGAVLFVAAGLGLIDIVFPDKGGLVGNLIGYLEAPFGQIASIVVIVVALAASFLITLNLPIKIKKIPFRIKNNDNEEKLTGDEEQETTGDLPDEEEEEDDDETEKESEDAETEPDESKKDNDGIIKKVLAPLGLKSSKIKPLSFANYVSPPLSLLKSSVEKPTAGDLRANANIIKRTLESFGIPVEMAEINIGPKFTRYTLKPAEGVKLSKITVLNQDISLALAAHPIRIEAPIPGKSLVGIEVPNKASAVVRLGSLMAYSEFQENGRLSFVMGRDVSGNPIFADIEKMPHLLIAGSTGSGKSIAIHSLLTSLLYKNSPETLRLALIDPKRVELSIYRDIPHLIAPVVTELKKAVSVFAWAISEMDRRYELFLAAGSRDIQSYNKKNPDDSLSYILIIIDELADLMATYGREIEGSIMRLAQMARATGIHLIVSTQRPSVEVITGLIKANITSRIALQLPTQVDSRTVLDSAGAEKLLGGGDMLFISSELSKPKRIQGAYISEEEIAKVVDFIRENNKNLGEETENVNFENGAAAENIFDQYSGGDAGDELFDEAVRVVGEAGKASASLLQRRLKVGYARAARLLDIMEDKGIVGPGDGAKPREVYLNNDNS
ncbi:MAG: DNA translocase FtsK 4TM domain-containing protein [Patescibacteria group bacterium]